VAKKEDAQYVRVQRSIWNKRRFQLVSEDAQRLYLYVIICPHGNMTGLFMLKPGYAIEDLRWEKKPELFTKGLHELLDVGLVNYDFENKIIFDYSQMEKFPPQNPNQIIGAISKLDELPITPLFRNLMDTTERFGKSLCKPLVEWLGKQETETEAELKDSKESSSGGKPPNVPPCPQQKIRDLYHEILPALPTVREWFEALQKILLARWKESSERQYLDWWREYFEYVKACPLLMGKENDFTFEPSQIPL